jgi:hypothetical protein
MHEGMDLQLKQSSYFATGDGIVSWQYSFGLWKSCGY